MVTGELIAVCALRRSSIVRIPSNTLINVR